MELVLGDLAKLMLSKGVCVHWEQLRGAIKPFNVLSFVLTVFTKFVATERISSSIDAFSAKG